ncbi:S-layer homology domain-containing protein [Cohnella endophytica]|uniref:S-layer homology domain-containing protein n=1 Tax=Cohnella endophytica TaxID=2419778 RepID=UPI001314428E|nr:S-layer homology domain-containing protein [Cohnella endophytica]
MRRMLSLFVAIAIMLVNIPAYAAAADKPMFKDVQSSHWAYASIVQAATAGYVKGFPDGTFRPNDPVTASQFMAMLVLSLTEKDGSGDINWSKETFARVPESSKEVTFYGVKFDFSLGKPWYINYVNTLKYLGVISGEFNGRFEEALTRERAASISNHMAEHLDDFILDSYAEVATSQIKDNAKIDTFSRASVGATVIRGLMTGFSDGNWQPKKVVTRAEAIAIIERVKNPSLRSPQIPNMSGKFYSDVPSYEFTALKRIVFPNLEMKKAYETLTGQLANFNGTSLIDSGKLWYYKDEKEKEKAKRKLFYFEKFADPEQYYDVVFNLSGNSYYVGLNIEKDGSINRAATPVNDLLKVIFNTADATTVSKLILNSATPSGTKVIGKRQIVINNLGNILAVTISAYPDSK